jgi:hypothetical protein
MEHLAMEDFAKSADSKRNCKVSSQSGDDVFFSVSDCIACK